MRRIAPALVVLLVAAVALAGCADGSGGFAPGEVTPVVLHLGRGDVAIQPWTYCLGNGCADGAPPAHLVDAGSPAEVHFGFGRQGWDFQATFRSLDPCPRTVTVPVEHDDDEYVVRPAGAAGAWQVDLTGRGPGGDVATSFAWTTPRAGSFPAAAHGSVAVLADHDGTLDSYGVELWLDDLAERDPAATATITVTSAAGRSTTIAPRLAQDCTAAGSLRFTAPRKAGLAATSLGRGPFEYRVEVSLHGRSYVGTGTWPDGEAPDLAPHVPLTWSPRLPAYRG